MMELPIGPCQHRYRFEVLRKLWARSKRAEVGKEGHWLMI